MTRPCVPHPPTAPLRECRHFHHEITEGGRASTWTRVRVARAIQRSGKKRRGTNRDRAVVHYAVKNVPVTLLMTRQNDESRPDGAEAASTCRSWNALEDSRPIS